MLSLLSTALIYCGARALVSTGLKGAVSISVAGPSFNGLIGGDAVRNSISRLYISLAWGRPPDGESRRRQTNSCSSAEVGEIPANIWASSDCAAMPLYGSPAIQPAALVSAELASCFLALLLLAALSGSPACVNAASASPQIGASGKSPIGSGQRCSVRGSLSLSRLVPLKPLKVAPF